jgi:hypothetical protein
VQVALLVRDNRISHPPMVAKEREADELFYDNEDYIVALREAYPTYDITYYANFDTIEF